MAPNSFEARKRDLEILEAMKDHYEADRQWVRDTPPAIWQLANNAVDMQDRYYDALNKAIDEKVRLGVLDAHTAIRLSRKAVLLRENSLHYIYGNLFPRFVEEWFAMQEEQVDQPRSFLGSRLDVSITPEQALAVWKANHFEPADYGIYLPENTTGFPWGKR
jgi:hypothetical protein